MCAQTYRHGHIYDEHCLATAHPFTNFYFSSYYNFAKLRPLMFNAIQPNLHSRDCADNLKFQLIFFNCSQERGYARKQNFACMEKILTAFPASTGTGCRLYG